MKSKSSKSGFSVVNIKINSDMFFYTGLSRKVFNALFKILKPHLPRPVYWRGRKAITAKYKKPKSQRKFQLLYKNKDAISAN